MTSGLLIRLRPTGPWRIGPDSGDRDRVDRIYHSDSLYSAVCSTMAQLGDLEEWLTATARSAEPEVRFSSCFPFQGDTRYVVPPRSLWPPPPSSKIRWKAARFIPLSLVQSLLDGQPVSEDAWTIDVQSECLLPASNSFSQGPFRIAVRSAAAIDRDGQGVLAHSSACLEFTPSSGLWMVAGFSSSQARDRWTSPLTAALRLLADSGFGGERSRGWGRSEMPEITAGELPGLLLRSDEQASSGYWLLSLFHPSASDQVDWTQGNYSLHTRNGRVESSAGQGDAKKPARMVAEGSVLVAAGALCGGATDVAPDGFPHPVYRSGFALAVPLPHNGRSTVRVRAPLPVVATPIQSHDHEGAVVESDVPVQGFDHRDQPLADARGSEGPPSRDYEEAVAEEKAPAQSEEVVVQNDTPIESSEPDQTVVEHDSPDPEVAE
jgi:CRISPR type III-A-associated RAMP protein Csm4